MAGMPTPGRVVLSASITLTLHSPHAFRQLNRIHLWAAHSRGSTFASNAQDRQSSHGRITRGKSAASVHVSAGVAVVVSVGVGGGGRDGPGTR